MNRSKSCDSYSDHEEVFRVSDTALNRIPEETINGHVSYFRSKLITFINKQFNKAKYSVSFIAKVNLWGAGNLRFDSISKYRF